MHFITYFAGPVCLLPPPTEKTAFQILFFASIILVALCLASIKVYEILKKKNSKQTVSRYWTKLLAIISGLLLLALSTGFFSGSKETRGYCNSGVWEGLQFPLIWMAIFMIIILLIYIISLGVLILYRVALAAKNRWFRNNPKT
ncbi:MAG: hypothetical protein V4702_01340 [Patescibacteria group bacterium]